jgi:hypothetical protein
MSILRVSANWKVPRLLSLRYSMHSLIYRCRQTVAEPMLYRHLGLSSELISDWHHTLLTQSGEECHPISVTLSRWYSLVATFTLSLVIHDPKGTLVSGGDPTHLTASQHFAVLLSSQADNLRTVVIEESAWMQWPSQHFVALFSLKASLRSMTLPIDDQPGLLAAIGSLQNLEELIVRVRGAFAIDVQAAKAWRLPRLCLLRWHSCPADVYHVSGPLPLVGFLARCRFKKLIHLDIGDNVRDSEVPHYRTLLRAHPDLQHLTISNGGRAILPLTQAPHRSFVDQYQLTLTLEDAKELADIEHGVFDISLSVPFEPSRVARYITDHLDTLHAAMSSLPKQRVQRIALRSLCQPFRWDGGGGDLAMRDLIAKLIPYISKFSDLGVDFVDGYNDVYEFKEL